ncbi:MAG: hypothetical protein ACK4RM_10245, partial [Flavobacterium sp.]
MQQNKHIELSPKTLFRNQIVLWLFLYSSWLWSQCPTVINTTQTFCDVQSPTIANLVAIDNGGGVAWFASATSTTPLASSVGLVNGSQYFADNTDGNCGNRVAVTVTIFGPPGGPPFQGFCNDDVTSFTVGDIIALGNNIQWYIASVGGTPLPLSTLLTTNTFYYASQTNPFTGCETSRKIVFVSVGFVPTPTGPSTQYFCINPGNPPTIANLIASGNNNWYTTISSTVPLSNNTPLVNGSTYYATTTDPPCESTSRLEVNVIIQPLNNAGNSETISICATETTTIGTVNLFDSLSGTPFATGSWLGPLTTTNGHLGTLDVSTLNAAGSPYIFTYTVDESFECPPVSSTVSVIISDPLSPGEDNSISICDNTGTIDLFNVLGGIPELGGSWSPSLSSGTGIFNPLIDAAGTYTYSIVDPICGELFSSVTVSVVMAPNPGEDGSTEICEDSALFELFDFLNGTPDPNGTWSPALASGTGVFNPAIDLPGVYTYTVLGTVPCLDESAT